ncbi:MAG: DNA methyltransferase [Anaerolineae bacterium]
MIDYGYQQRALLSDDGEAETRGPMTCLGITFPDDAARRAYFGDRLAEHLQDLAFRQIEGFPIGADEDILALSDPPYYTACPNPFLAEIIAQWQREREETRAALGLPADGENGAYQREPFAADVSEGKNDPIYNAHSYHTKVPHKAIMRYILHYTDPGDIVFDGFCGTGMTGVAAQLCGDRKAVESLGYHVDADGLIYDHPPLPTSSFIVPPSSFPISRLGPRKAVLNDLSPAATFIAYNYNTPVDTAAFETEARRILAEVEAELGWMYETWHPHCEHPQRVKARINYTVWSEEFVCPNCSQELVFLQEALDRETGFVRDEFPCPHCEARVSKNDLHLILDTYLDQFSRQICRRPRLRPVLINYTVGKKAYEKEPDAFDLAILQRIDEQPMPQEVPSLSLPDMQMARVGRMKTTGVSSIRQFFLARPAQSLAFLWRHAQRFQDTRTRHFLLFFAEQAIWTMSRLNRYRPRGYSQVNQYLTGVYYVASQIAEVSPWYVLEGKLNRLIRVLGLLKSGINQTAVVTASVDAQPAREGCIDYIFTDPPFGENIYYAQYLRQIRLM